jgi:hypothetical protein
MTAAQWQEVKSVFARALEAPPAERGALVAEACGADAALRREVESLLAASDGDDSLPAARAAVAREVAAHAPAAGADGLARAVASGAEHARNGAPADDPAMRAVLERELGHHYDILERLGQGGMGAVYLARERALERFVAIKVLRPDLAGAEESRERFRREARVAANLSHPGILPLHTFDEVGGLWYFVMGYVRGESLAGRLALEGRLPCEEARRILAELADALECAHRHGVVHRDIKPANVLLDAESGRALLADFGISKIRGAGDSLTATGVVVGTPHYMSPEQAVGSRDVDARSDIYSLGAVGYTMLAGREPFAGTSSENLIYRRVAHDPPPLSTVAPSVPPELAAVVMRCLAREPAARWPSARSLKEALGRAWCETAAPLPEAVRDLPGFAPYALAWAVGWAALAALAVESAGDRGLLLLIALLVPVGLALHVWNVGRQELRLAELARIACWPPEWWGMWWPAALRRPSDLWSRLPRPARLVRAVLSTFFVALPALILVRHRVAAGDAPADDARRDWFVVAEAALVLGAGAVVGGALRWGVRQGLTPGETVRVLFGATTPAPAWRTPQVARLLAPVPGGVRPPDRDSPSDFPRAIDELVQLLPAESRAAGEDAAHAARRVLAAITSYDRDIARIARDVGTSDEDRLAARLAELDESPSTVTGERHELRQLVRRQLELVRQLRASAELAARKRAHLLDLLRGLWAQLYVVQDGCGAGRGALSDDGVRALCAAIAEQLPAQEPAERSAAGVAG